MKKIPTDYLKYFWPMRHYLVTCGRPGTANIIAVSFCMPVSKQPPMVVCAIGRSAYSCALIRENPEFAVNVPTQELKRAIYYCGAHSGRDVDKFQATGLTAEPSRHLATPIIGECVAHMECRVEQEVSAGDKVLFLARVIEAYADEDLVRGIRQVEYAAGDFPARVYGGRFPSAHPHDAPPEGPTPAEGADDQVGTGRPT
jgi:flavin reductase (DIM6/NTAB) family NADH-FMN oxidoreductase RutF